MIENLKSIAPLGKVIMSDWCEHSYSAIDTRVYGGKRYDY